MEDQIKFYSITGIILEGTYTPFSGFFFPELSEQQGLMGDSQGISTLSNLEFNENAGICSFDKIYSGREEEPIKWHLRRDRSIWKGRYEGNFVLCGGLIAKIRPEEFSEEIIEQIRCLERSPGKIARGIFDSLTTREVLIKTDEGRYDINPSREDPEDFEEGDLPF